MLLPWPTYEKDDLIPLYETPIIVGRERPRREVGSRHLISGYAVVQIKIGILPIQELLGFLWAVHEQNFGLGKIWSVARPQITNAALPSEHNGSIIASNMEMQK